MALHLCGAASCTIIHQERPLKMLWAIAAENMTILSLLAANKFNLYATGH